MARRGKRGREGGTGSRRGGRGGGGSVGGDARPVYVFSREAIRCVDRLCVERYGIPSIVLMENAARGLAGIVLDVVAQGAGERVLVCAGTGNNGGDGFAAARHLHNAGVPVRVVVVGDRSRCSEDGATNLGIIEKMGLEVEACAGEGVEDRVVELARGMGDGGVVVDALLGTGLSRAVEGDAAGAVRAANRLGAGGWAVVAADVPSGLDAESGEALVPREAGGVGEAVRAAVTVAFAGLKRGFLAPGAEEYIGEVVVAGIGAPRELLEELGEPVRVVGVRGEG